MDVSFACGRSAFLVAGTLALCACALVGPQSITGSRGLYTEVINRTEDEQILNMLVRLHYDGAAHPSAVVAARQDIGRTQCRETDAFPSDGPQGAPNVLLIMIDDLGFAGMSAFGGVTPTPRFDQLAKSSLRYNHFHSTCASRSVLLRRNDDTRFTAFVSRDGSVILL